MKKKLVVLFFVMCNFLITIQRANALNARPIEAFNAILSTLNFLSNNDKTYYGSQGKEDLVPSRRLQVDRQIANIPAGSFKNMPYSEYCNYEGNVTESFDINMRCQVIFGDQISNGEIIGQPSNITIYNTNNYRKNTYIKLPYKHDL